MDCDVTSTKVCQPFFCTKRNINSTKRQEAVRDNVSPSSLYGAEHLLRLFVKLPELLAYVKIEEETFTQLQQKLVKFLKFLQNNESTFFLATYDRPRVADRGKGKDN